jgi:hypothetical protein
VSREPALCSLGQPLPPLQSRRSLEPLRLFANGDLSRQPLNAGRAEEANDAFGVILDVLCVP